MLKQPDEIRGAYSETRTAEDYIDKRFTSAWGSVMHATQVTALNRVIREHGVKRVLEIAPGPARLSREVTGFDRGVLCEFNDSMLQVARKRLASANGRWRIVRGDAFHLPLQPTLNLDLVYTFRFIRHFEAADRTALYQQVRSVLKDGGLFVFDAVNVKVGLPSRIREGLEHQPIHDEYYTRESIEDELRRHGFTIVALTDVIRHMRLQQWIQVYIAPRSHGLARQLIRSLEEVPGQPLEWIVVCRKTPTR